MNANNEHRTYTYYGWVSGLQYWQIFYPFPQELKDLPVGELQLSLKLTTYIKRYKQCVTVDDVLSLTDADILYMKNTGPEAVRQIRTALFHLSGENLPWHAYFDDEDVREYIG